MRRLEAKALISYFIQERGCPLKIYSLFVRKHPLCKNALYSFCFLCPYSFSLTISSSLWFILQEGMAARWVTIHTLGDSGGVLVFYKQYQDEPSGKLLDVRVSNLASNSGRNFLFLLLLMANICSPIPVETRGSRDDGKTAGRTAAISCSLLFLYRAWSWSCRPILEELLCRAIIPRLIFRGRTDRVT